MKNLQPLRGFRDLYPEDKAVQNYIFETVRSVAALYGYSEYDGPIVEPLELYTDKTSEEILSKQAFEVMSKGQELEKWILRPEMTPTLARMVASRAGELTFPLRLFNIGPRFRYEAPQKGRSREFWQTDFDLLGSSSVLADAEILLLVVEIFKKLGAGENEFIIFLNNRAEMEKNLLRIGYTEEGYNSLLPLIDRQDKISKDEFIAELLTIDPSQERAQKLVDFLYTSRTEESVYFTELFDILKSYKIDQFFQINYNITRGLDYYTGLVFEVKSKGSLKRSLLGGGRYDNLVGQYNPKYPISGVGMSFSDVVTAEFLKDTNILPPFTKTPATVLVTTFDEQTRNISIETASKLRALGIPVELYPDSGKKLDKQLKYADKMNIPYAVIIGPNEVERGMVILKDLKNKTQKEIKVEELTSSLSSRT
ncbi:histidine--tRNA ligase [Candidatus Microgenomates bacterium]|nr:histidine--tRNA ligase [Candidatus Microgenomates bacterium]